MAYMHRLKFLPGVLAALFALTDGALPSLAATRCLVRTVRYSSSGEGTRIVIDLSRPAAFSAELSGDSTALVVAIPDAVSESSMGEVAIDHHGIRSVVTRTLGGVGTESRVEVSLLLSDLVSWESFPLPAGGGKPARIVLDVTPAPRAPGAEPDVADTVETGAPPATSPESDVRVTEGGAGMTPRPFVVAIDPGHGGHDTGTVGRYGLVEKKLCLDIARRVAADLNARGGIRAVLTRDRDVYLTLPERNELAEKMGADVFVSIHLNSAPSSSARGAEIYFVAPAGAERAASRELASGEAADEFGLDRRRDGDIVHMLLDVNQQSILARSELLAASILDEVRERKLLPTRAVKQKSFSVLRTISMPSVLVEAGFLSNGSDAKLIRESEGRERIADAIATGVVDFFRVHPPQRGGEEARALVHRVQRGDTLWTISRRYNTTVQRLCELNGFGKSQALRVGQELVVRRN